MPSYAIKFNKVTVPSGSGGESFTLHETPSGVSEQISLVDGKSSYTTQNKFNGTGSVSLSFSIGPPSTITETASVVAPITVSIAQHIITDIDSSNPNMDIDPNKPKTDVRT